MCENRSCNHTLEEHPRIECEKCECKKFEKNEFTIYLKYDGCSHSINNFLERKCPNCENPTTMTMGGMGEDDPFHTIKLEKSEFGWSITTALHKCQKCGLISYYDIGASFPRVLHDLRFKAELKKREQK